MGQDQQNTAAAAVVLPSSSSASASAAQVSTYRPHAIVVNVVQVSGTTEPFYSRYLWGQPSFHVLYYTRCPHSGVSL